MTPTIGEEIISSQGSLPDRDSELLRRVSYEVIQMGVIKSRLVRTWQQNQQLIDSYRRTQDYVEDFNRPTRFPGAFGMTRRIFSEVIQNTPEVEIESTTRSKNDLASAQAIQHSIEHAKDITNYYRERAKVIKDMTGAPGNGILHVGYKNLGKKKNTLAFRRVDPRFFFMDHTALNLHDSTDGTLGARHCFEDVVIPITTFRKQYAGVKGFRNIDLVQGVDKIVPRLGLLSMVYDSESYMNSITAGQYVQMGFWCSAEQNEFAIIANGIPIFSSTLKEEYPHGRLPYVHYKMFERNDLIWADSIVDVSYAMFVQADLLNTMEMQNIQYSMMRPTFIAGNMSLDGEEQLIRPGAIIRVNGVNGGKVADSIYQIQMGADDKAFYNARTMLSDEITLATGDDSRGLFSNPDQLATQTAYKARTLTKLMKTTVLMNEMDAVKTETELIVETMKGCYGDADQMIVPVKGYKVKQSSRGKIRRPKFEKSPKTNDSFVLYPNILDTDYRVVVKPKTVKDDEDQQSVQNTISFLQNLMQLMNLLPDLAQKMDIYSFIYDLADRLGVDIKNVFPDVTVNSAEDGEDAAHQIMQGGSPDSNSNPQEQMEQMLQIRQSPQFQQMSMQQKQVFDKKLKELAAFRARSGQQPQQMQQQMTPQVNTGAPGLAAPAVQPAAGPLAPGVIANSATNKTIGQ